MYPAQTNAVPLGGLQGQYVPQTSYGDTTPKESQFSIESQRLVNNIASLEGTIAELFKRLQPVLAPISGAGSARQDAPTPTRSTVVQSIASSADRVATIQQALNSIISSLEV